ncbi:NUDIX hydrolase [Paraclostridium sp.]|uniref:NUDIX hydrolase n=1 Tax=Paraclostridium sp. TaxID=2023273 RepID=UPI003F67FB75
MISIIKVNFYNWEEIESDNLLFAVIVARFKDKWVLSKHKERTTWEIPGGHREIGEDINNTAARELYEESGANKFEMFPICVYSVSKEVGDISKHPTETFGGLYFAEIAEFKSLPNLEIDEIILLDELPKELTYPEIQPQLLSKAIDFIKEINNTHGIKYNDFNLSSDR